MRLSRRPWLAAAVAWILYAALAVSATWPLAARLDRQLPQGNEPACTVPLLNLWTLWWNVDRWEHGLDDYWQAPIFHPVPGTFAFSEPQPVAGLLVWPAWHLLPTPAAVYNVWLLFSLAANGWFSYRLLRGQRLAAVVSLAGGAMVVMLPIVHWQLGILQNVPLWSLIWSVDQLLRYCRRPSWSSATVLGLAVAISYGLCCNLTLFLVLLLVPAGSIVLARRWLAGRSWVQLGWAVGLAVLLTTPIWQAQQQYLNQAHFARPEKQLRILSVMPRHYWRTAYRQLLPLPGGWRNPDGTPWKLSPGTIKWCLAAVGLSLGWMRRRYRPLVALATVFVVGGVAFSMGPHLTLGGWSPYLAAAEFIPGLPHVRNLFRFAYFVQLALLWLAAVGLSETHRHVTRLPRLRRRSARQRLFVHRAWGLACSSLAVLAVIEVWPTPPRLCDLPFDREPVGWIGWLENNSTPHEVLVHLPLPASSTAGAYEATTESMYAQMFHGRRMLNGYSGYFPAPFAELKAAAQHDDPDLLVAQLRALQADLCVVRRDDPINRIPQQLAWPRLYPARTATDSHIYRVLPP